MKLSDQLRIALITAGLPTRFEYPNSRDFVDLYEIKKPLNICGEKFRGVESHKRKKKGKNNA